METSCDIMQDEAWIPCIYELAMPEGTAQMAGPVISNATDQDFQIYFRLPLPAMKGNLRLHIDGMRLGVYTADPGNHVVKFNVSGVRYDNVDVLMKVLEPVTSKMMKEHRFPAMDVSQWESVVVRAWCTVNHPVKIAISTALLHCYYA